jgi:hypothetical protein
MEDSKTIIITKEDNEKWYNSLTKEEQYNFLINTYRGLRNQKLKKTDIHMVQTDRYTQNQLDQLKTYRQDLRDMININQDRLKAFEPVLYPQEPDFLKGIRQ